MVEGVSGVSKNVVYSSQRADQSVSDKVYNISKKGVMNSKDTVEISNNHLMTDGTKGFYKGSTAAKLQQSYNELDMYVNGDVAAEKAITKKANDTVLFSQADNTSTSSKVSDMNKDLGKIVNLEF